MFMIHNRNDQLKNSTGCETRHEKNTTTTVADHDEGVHHQGYESDGAENATHCEGVFYFGHREEVCFVCWRFVSTFSLR